MVLTAKVKTFLEMIKFEHSIFALPFAYLGLILAEGGWPSLSLFGWVSLAMLSFRTMAMGLNRLIDAALDAQNPRTEKRALPAAKLTPAFVWLVSGIALAVFEIAAYRLGPLCLRLSPIPVLLAWLYPWTKRFTWLSHFVLGMILGIAPYGAWLGSRGEFSWVPAGLMLGVVAWVAGFDMIYALQDVAFDRQHGLQSFPVRFGVGATLRATRILHAVTLVSWFLAGRGAGLGSVYGVGMGLVSFFLIREHWLIRNFGLRKVEEAFFTMNAAVSMAVLFAAVADISVGRFLS